MSEWLAKMPAIPLARAVPVRERGVLGVVVEVGDDADVYVAFGPYGGRLSPGGEWRPCADVRVDLDDPQGFAYALRYGWAHYKHAMTSMDAEAHVQTLGVCTNHWRLDCTTDADRLALATALRAVVPS